MTHARVLRARSGGAAMLSGCEIRPELGPISGQNGGKAHRPGRAVIGRDYFLR